jgi:NitT/TauT family transport system ATP-binding protein
MSAVVHNLKPEAATAKIELRDVCLSYFTPEGETEALSQVSFALAPGEFVSLIGQSGCGKSTLLSLIAGLITPTSGAVMIDGQAVTEPNPRIGYMLQQDYLFEWRTILDNVMLGAEIQGRRDARSEARAVHLLEKCGLGAFLAHTPRQLSGGMRQRAALARTLVTEPDVILLDEPFSALDSQTRLAISDEVVDILRREGKTVVLVTHDIGEAIAMTDRVIVLSRRPGRLKSQYRIHYGDGARPTPFQARSRPEFNTYFKQLWDELDVHVEG